MESGVVGSPHRPLLQPAFEGDDLMAPPDPTRHLRPIPWANTAPAPTKWEAIPLAV